MPSSPARPTSAELRQKLDTLLMGGFGPLPMDLVAASTGPLPTDEEQRALLKKQREAIFGRPLTPAETEMLDSLGLG